MTTYALITCAGVGKRMGSQMNKIFLLLEEDPVVARTIKRFEECERIDSIILICREEDKSEIESLCKKYSFLKVSKVVLGGEKRQHSVYNGLISVEAKADDIIVIHNGVNPFIDDKTIREVIEAAQKYEAAVVGFRARDTIKEVDVKGFVTKTLDRKHLWQVQTPQAIRYGTAIKAFKKAFDEEFFGTDDVMLVERLGKKVKMVECPYENIKITLPNDLEFGKHLLKDARIGFGMDSHRFMSDEGKQLVIGGVAFEGRGFSANSDGDVILHALFNAISQSLGDHGLSYYADPLCEQGITDSRKYLNVMLKIMDERGYKISNVGVMLEGKVPKILPKEEELKTSLDSLLSIGKENIGIAATTGEGLTPFGKGEGMQCFCVVTLRKK